MTYLEICSVGDESDELQLRRGPDLRWYFLRKPLGELLTVKTSKPSQDRLGCLLVDAKSVQYTRDDRTTNNVS